MDQMKSQFISNVSHELRTPVTVLRSYIDTLYNYGEEFDEETKKRIHWNLKYRNYSFK